MFQEIDSQLYERCRQQCEEVEQQPVEEQAAELEQVLGGQAEVRGLGRTRGEQTTFRLHSQSINYPIFLLRENKISRNEIYFLIFFSPYLY